MGKLPTYGTKNYTEKSKKKRKGRHAKTPNPKHKVYKKYRGQGR
jgi:hypothetical protein